MGGVRDRLQHLSGVFGHAESVREEGRLAPGEEERLERLFNAHLPCPPFRASLASGEWSEDAVAWYRDDAIWMIRRTWELALLLREHGRPVRFVHCPSPGRIVYSDEYQVVADSRKPDRPAGHLPA